jgi:hypothetical protein
MSDHAKDVCKRDSRGVCRLQIDGRRLSLAKKYGCSACDQACAAALESGGTDPDSDPRIIDLASLL